VGDWILEVNERISGPVKRARTREEGQGMVEYALILMLIAIVVIVVVSTVGHTVNNVFSNVSNGLSS
jgi:pilus assembly protein Flp/PilA